MLVLGTKKGGLYSSERGAGGCAPDGRHALLMKGSLTIRCWKQKGGGWSFRHEIKTSTRHVAMEKRQISEI